MKRHLITLVAAILCLVGVTQIVAAQTGPVGSPATNFNQKSGVTPQGIAALLRPSAKKVEIKQAQECDIVFASVRFEYQGQIWNGNIEIEFYADEIALVCPLRDLNKLTKPQLEQVKRLGLPAGQQIASDDGWLVLESEIRRAPKDVSEAELVKQIESMLGSMAKTQLIWNVQKAPNQATPALPTPAAPKANPMPAPKGPVAVPHGAPSEEVIKAAAAKFRWGLAYSDTTTKLKFNYKSFSYGTPFKRAFDTVSGGRVQLDMYPVTVEFQKTEHWADGTIRTYTYADIHQFYRNNGEWACFSFAKN